MRIKDNYSIFRDIEVPKTLEHQLWQSGVVKYGYIDITKGDNNGQHNNSNFNRGNRGNYNQ